MTVIKRTSKIKFMIPKRFGAVRPAFLATLSFLETPKNWYLIEKKKHTKGNK